MILIHTALLSEAQAIIETYKLSKISSNPKIYSNENIVLLIGGIGKENTFRSVEFVFEKYDITKAINIGISGCSDKSVQISELFCTNKKLEDIAFMQLITVDNPQIEDTKLQVLYDMEGQYFEQTSKKYLKDDDIFVFKVVSDHLDDTIPKKDFVKKLIRDSLPLFADKLFFV